MSATVLTLPLSAVADQGVNGVTAVSSKVSGDYKRTKLPDGLFQPELYAFGEGGYWGGEISDSTIDKIKFADVAKVIAGPLAGQSYLPAKDPKTTKLLIMLYWGTTAAPAAPEEDPLYISYFAGLAEFRLLMSEIPPNVDGANHAMTGALHFLNTANHLRDQLDFKNAAMLGYSDSGLIGTDYGNNIKHGAWLSKHAIRYWR